MLWIMCAPLGVNSLLSSSPRLTPSDRIPLSYVAEYY